MDKAEGKKQRALSIFHYYIPLQFGVVIGR